MPRSVPTIRLTLPTTITAPGAGRSCGLRGLQACRGGCVGCLHAGGRRRLGGLRAGRAGGLGGLGRLKGVDALPLDHRFPSALLRCSRVALGAASVDADLQVGWLLPRV